MGVKYWHQRLIARSITKRRDRDMTATKTLTTAQLAEKFQTSPRELRKFLRADARANGKANTLPGKGSRYALPGDAKTINAMRKRFDAWTVAQAEAAKVREAAKKIEADSVREDDEVEDSVETDEPTDEDLSDIEDED